MKTLIDSHVMLWALLSPEKLSPAAAEILADPETTILVSYATAWELTLKTRRLRLGPLGRFLEKGMKSLGATWLPIEISHIAKVAELPSIHGDPFDRMLVAQAIGEQVSLITADEVLARYPVPVVW
jgi:PIN domain nuclease of toxin-antitoxin system